MPEAFTPIESEKSIDLNSLTTAELAEVMKHRQPRFSAKSLLDIGIGGNNVAGLPNKPKKVQRAVPQRIAFGRRNRSLQPVRTCKKYYHPFGKATEIQKFALRIEEFKEMQQKYS